MSSPSLLSERTNLPRRSPRHKKSLSKIVNTSTSLTNPLVSPSVETNTESAPPSRIDGSNTVVASNAYTANNSAPVVVSGAEINETDQRVEFTTKVYTFLCQVNKPNLRKTCNAWGKRLAGTKTKLQYRAFLWVRQLQSMRKDINRALDDNTGCGSFSEFLDKSEMSDMAWQIPPPDKEMKQHLIKFGVKVPKEVDGSNCNTSGNVDPSANQDPNFSHSEFARLILVMRDDETAKSALYSLSKSLSKDAQDAGIKRETYWNVIADRFNDKKLKLNYSFAGQVDDVDVSQAPPCFRSGTALKDHFQKARPEFTKALRSWKKSGQNDPEKFTDYLSYHNGVMYSIGKRVLIIFVCCGLGTPYTHALLYESATKEIVTGGCEEGVDRTDTDKEESRGERKRKRGSSAVFGEVAKVTKDVKHLSSIMKSFLESEGGASVTTKADARSRDEGQEEEVLFRRVKDTFQELKCAEKDSMPRIVEFARIRHNKALEEYERLMATRLTSDNPNIDKNSVAIV